MQDYLFSNGVGIPPFPNVFNHLLDLLFLGAFDDVIGMRALVGSNEIRVIPSMLFVNSLHCGFFHKAGDRGLFTRILFLYRTDLRLVVESTFALSEIFHLV